MKEKRFMPEEVIFTENEVNDKFYIIMHGSVELFITQGSQRKVFKKLSKGSTFGSKSFLTRDATHCGVTA